MDKIISELESLKINGQSLEDYKKQNTIEIIEGAMVIGSGRYAIQYLKSGSTVILVVNF